MSKARRLARGLLIIALLGGAITLLGCRREEVDDGTVPKAASLPELTLREDSDDELLLTWVDAKGDGHTVTRIEDVPIEGRDRVRVVIIGKEEGTRELFYVANLTVKGQDGTYPVTTVPRSEWDAMIQKRRMPKAPPPESPMPPPAQAAPAPPSEPAEESPRGATVIIYSASWCSACQSAIAYLKQRRVPFIEKDIDEDHNAAEMDRKLRRAGIRGGSIPVLDIRGRILVGFDRRAIDKALSGGSSGVAL